MAPYTPDPWYLERLPNEGKQRWYICKVCPAPRPRRLQNCKTHENSREHQQAIEAFLRRPPPTPSPPHPSLHPLDNPLKEDALRAFLVSASPDPNQPLYPPGHQYYEPNFPNAAAGPSSPSPFSGIDWNLHAAQQAFQDEESLTPQEAYQRQLCQKTLDLLNGDISDFDAGMDQSSSSSTSETSLHHNDLPQKRARGGEIDPKTAREWFPWPDRLTWSLDILMHLPRSVFSRKQLDLFLWLLRINNVDQVPTTKSMKTLNGVLQNMCGVETLRYEGKLGHTYYVNSLSQMLAQEMCNPQVRPHLYFYPEDTGKRVEETRQASNWLHEMSPDDATPMVRIQKEDYYIYEPALLSNGTICIPFRWFTRAGKYCAKAWILEAKRDINPDDEGWIIRKDRQIDISEEMLLKNFPRLCNDYKSYGIPHPSRILGIHNNDAINGELSRWNHTNPVVGNQWRKLSKGCRTLSLPLWTYCDDTSGNQSKKWNEHNSFLFTLAGLPREEVSKEYNVHFLCTSNIAPPLEMLDGVVDQIEKAKQDGIWAWDCVFQEPVLVVPAVPSMLGDNPMQSEFCCHIGSQGKYFCRICMVKGTDIEDSGTRPLQPGQSPNNSPAPSIASNSDGSIMESASGTQNPQNPAPPHPKKKATETMEAMLRRISEFMKPGIPRTKQNTKTILSGYSEEAKILHSKTRLAKSRTETGIKDTFQEFFFARLFSSYKSKRGADKQAALDDAIRSLPDDITSPIWRLGLDPHSDTPVEILHVVLLGFVKYFWRDLVQNQINNEQKQTLITWLNSLDVQGLGISRLGGATLVNYAGSLTGRDFCAISQVAPFVIYDMVPSDVYDAWVALSTLVPLIWQPVIEDIDKFCETLETEIQNFLIKTVKWTCQWFNKSKFHILLHLPQHIQRFGPAILFATESFESFNAVIQAKSIHSNRQAPSRDIALGFAQGNRVRHLMSGGFFLTEDHIEQWHKNPETMTVYNWSSIGEGPARLMKVDPTPSHYLGLSKNINKLPGLCKGDNKPPRALQDTLSAKHLPQAFPGSPPSTLCATNSDVNLENGDICAIGQYVVVHDPHTQPFIACVREILQFVGSPAHQHGLPQGVLLQTAQHTLGPQPLPMPRLRLIDQWTFVGFKQILCTVNVQHDCRRHECQTNGVRYVVQERTRTSQTVPVVQHRNYPDDLILNTAQMRDAVHLQKFRQGSTRLADSEVSKIVHESVAQTINSRKATETSENRRGGARGRGGGRATVRAGGAGRGRGRVAPLSPGESVINFFM